MNLPWGRTLMALSGGLKKKSNRIVLEDWLNSKTPLRMYEDISKRVQEGVARFYGPRWSAQSLVMCLTLALLYTPLAFLVGYAKGFDEGNLASPLIRFSHLPGSFGAFVAIVGIALVRYLIKTRNTILQGKARSRLRELFWIVLFALFLGAVTLNRSKDWRAVGAVVGGHLTLSALLVGFRVSGALGILLANTVAVGLSTFFFSVGAGAVACLALIGVVLCRGHAVAIAECQEHGGNTPRFFRPESRSQQGLVLSYLFALGACLAGGTAAALGRGLGQANLSDQKAEAITFFFFFAILPIANALVDQLSWMFSRYYMAQAQKSHNVLVIIADILMDSALALVLMGAMAVASVGLIDLLNQLLGNGLGGACMDWREIALNAKLDPWGRGFMVSSMVVTTLIPTALHLLIGMCAGGFAILRRLPLSKAVKAIYSKPGTEGNDFEPLLVAGVLLGTGVLLCAVLWGFWELALLVKHLDLPSHVYDLLIAIYQEDTCKPG